MPFYVLDNGQNLYEILTYENPETLVTFEAGHMEGILSHPSVADMKTYINMMPVAVMQIKGVGHKHPSAPFCEGVILPEPTGVPPVNRMCFVGMSGVALAGDTIKCRCPMTSLALPGVNSVPRPPLEDTFLDDSWGNIKQGLKWNAMKWVVIGGLGGAVAVATGGGAVVAFAWVMGADVLKDIGETVAFGFVEAGLKKIYTKTGQPSPDNEASVVLSSLQLIKAFDEADDIVFKEVVLISQRRARTVGGMFGLGDAATDVENNTLSRIQDREIQMKAKADDAKATAEKYVAFLKRYEGAGNKALPEWVGMTKLVLKSQGDGKRTITTKKDERKKQAASQA